jgi:solute carrier family 25 (mitochondrial phosphate transporter), member 23/24/25/41
MSTFEALKLAYLRSTSKEEPEVLTVLAFGSISGSVGATSVYPLNLVRTRLQASGSSGHPQRYSGVWDVVIKTYERDGWRGFYRGLFPTLAKVHYFREFLAVHSLTFTAGCASSLNIVCHL